MAEIELMVESYNNKLKRELLYRADMDNRNAINLTNKISMLMSKDTKEIKFEDLYGHLLEESDVHTEKIETKEKLNKHGLTEVEEAMMIQQQMMFMQFASKHNKKYE